MSMATCEKQHIAQTCERPLRASGVREQGWGPGKARRPESQSYLFSLCELGPSSFFEPLFPHLKTFLVIPRS